MFFKIVCFFCYFYRVFGGSIQTKNWDYTPVSIDANSINEELLKIVPKIDRISRGVYGISGEGYLRVEVKAYRSATGSNNYKALPYEIHNQTAREFMNSFYKILLMPSLKECSNAPQCSEDEDPVIDYNLLYKLDKCQISTDNFPSHLMPGFYKLVGTFSGVVDGFLELIVEVTSKEVW